MDMNSQFTFWLYLHVRIEPLNAKWLGNWMETTKFWICWSEKFKM